MIIIIHSLAQPPDGWVATPKPRLTPGHAPTGPVRSSLQPVSLPTSGNHVGTTRESFETMPAGSGDVPETVPRPPTLPEFAEVLAWSIDLQPSAHIPSRTSPPGSACEPETLGRPGQSSRLTKEFIGERETAIRDPVWFHTTQSGRCHGSLWFQGSSD
jgi:hypothetical protein